MENLYKAQNARHQQAINDYLHQFAFFAFSDEQFREGLDKLGLTLEDKGALVTIPGGGFILKDKADGFREILVTAGQERQAALADPESGYQFALDMFLYELANHEYTYTGDESETLAALGFTCEDIAKSPQLSKALREAEKILLKEEA